MLLGGQHPGLLATQQRLIDLIRLSGDEGIISSEVPKRYEMHYGEKLELEAVSSAGGGGSAAVEKVKIKDLVLTQPGVTVSMHKGVQPRCVCMSCGIYLKDSRKRLHLCMRFHFTNHTTHIRVPPPHTTTGTCSTSSKRRRTRRCCGSRSSSCRTRCKQPLRERSDKQQPHA